MTDEKKSIVHGTAVALPGLQEPAAVLLRGLSGAGKSDLAFRLIEEGGALISDDQVVLERRQEKIYASGLEAIRGLLEVRGVGLLRYAPAGPASLRMIVDLCAREDVPRLPFPETLDILGLKIPFLKLHAFDASSSAKVRKALSVVNNPRLLVQ